MSTNSQSEPVQSQTATAGSKKKKNNKKKNNTAKSNNNTNGLYTDTKDKDNVEQHLDTDHNTTVQHDTIEDASPSEPNTPRDVLPDHHLPSDELYIADEIPNGHIDTGSHNTTSTLQISQKEPVVQPSTPVLEPEVKVNDHHVIESVTSTSDPNEIQPHENGETPSKAEFPQSNMAIDTDTEQRLKVMSEDREALRVEMSQLRQQIELLQTKHDEELASLRNDLEESESAKDQAIDQFETLRGRIGGIKATLGDRMKVKDAALDDANERNEQLESQLDSLKETNEALQRELSRLSEEATENAAELSSLRNRNTLSQQNFNSERDDLLEQNAHLRQEVDAAKDAMGEWEVLAMEERSIRENLAERVAELEDELSRHKESSDRAESERDIQLHAVEGLQRALHEVQEARRIELRETVERTDTQLEALNKLVQQAEARATQAESSNRDLESALERAAPFEKEVKEKNLLIGKLRHEAIVLNDHLTKALRFLKKARPEENIDRQVVTNHFLQFLALDRSDPKKFQVLQIISALLDWTDEQKEQAGLARRGTASGSLRLPSSPFNRTPSTPALNSEFFPETPSGPRESLAELWEGFLATEARSGLADTSPAASRSASISSNVPPDRK